MDTTHSGIGEWLVREKAPFALSEGESLVLDIFVDKSVIEVYANERQAICRRVYPSDPHDAVRVLALADGAYFKEIKVREMMPSNMY